MIFSVPRESQGWAGHAQHHWPQVNFTPATGDELGAIGQQAHCSQSAVLLYSIYLPIGLKLRSSRPPSSALVGIFFGFYPARRASKLLPIQALHYA